MTNALENHTFLQISFCRDEEMLRRSSLSLLDLKDLMGSWDFLNFVGNVGGIYSKI